MGREGNRWPLAFVAAVSVGAILAVALIDPARTTLFPPCPFHAITGYHCPGCGTLRGLHQLCRGHLVQALDLNALMVVCLPPVAYACFVRLVHGFTGRRLPTVRLSAAVIWTLLGLILAFWILRNIPAHPFSVLSP